MVFRLMIAPGRLGGGEVHPRVGICLQEGIQAGVGAVAHQVPVVQPGPFQVPVAQGEAQRLHQMQHRAGGSAGAGNVAGILRDFRVHQDNVHGHFAATSP